MRAKTGNALLKLLVVLAVIAGGVFAALFLFRATAVVEEVTRDVAVDAVPGSVEVLADKGLQQLKIEGSGRVTDAERLNPPATFEANDLLLTLDTTEIERQWAERQRALNSEKEKLEAQNAGTDREKLAKDFLAEKTRLFDNGRASLEEKKAAERALNETRNQIKLYNLALAKIQDDLDAEKKAHDVQVSRMEVRAPMAGMVEGVFVAKGALVNAGATVATFFPADRVVLAKVSEEDFAKVELGDKARVQLLSVPNKQFDAKVTKLYPFADAETRRFTVFLEVEADIAMLRPNSTGEVTITTDRHENVPMVPRRAITFGNVVYVVKDGRVERRQIEVGFRGLVSAEVTKGLEPGEKVIVERIDQFRDGQRVKIEAPKKR